MGRTRRVAVREADRPPMSARTVRRVGITNRLPLPLSRPASPASAPSPPLRQGEGGGGVRGLPWSHPLRRYRRQKPSGSQVVPSGQAILQSVPTHGKYPAGTTNENSPVSARFQ